jgi:arginine repressor
MVHFKLFEQFINEAKVYTLKDFVEDTGDINLKKTAEIISATLGEDLKKIAVITNEDDDYDDYYKKYEDSKFENFSNPSVEMSTKYSKHDNVIHFNDGSAMGFFIPVKKL